ncbi:MAG: TIGR04282 family arsenosugar biosynthesis glycosyltransferase [Alphaproteobacteria bacterium]
MRLKNHLVIFVRAPRLGAVKTRLAADVGGLKAWQFYRRTTAGIVRRLAADPRWTCWLAVTPDRFVRHGRSWPRRPRRFPQGGGDLGARMRRPARRLPPGPVVIIGSDVPDVTPEHVARAFALLGGNDAVFGPTPDGGYWLVGLRRRPHTPDAFRGVRWSGPHALKDTRANLGPRHRVVLLDELPDIDEGRDLARWRAAARARRRGAAGLPA